MDENKARDMTTEEVQSLSSDQLIEMVGNNEKIPYEKMTDEQLDLMEEIMAAFMDAETQEDLPLSLEEKTHSKQRILRDVNKIDTEKLSKFTQKETTVKLKSRHTERTVKKMDTSKKNLFVKRHDMRQRMIEPTTVTFVRKLKSEKLQFMSQGEGDEEEKGETDAAVEVGRLKLKEFFGIEDEMESKPKSEVRVNKLNVHNLFSSNKDEQEVKSPERPEVRKLNIKEAFNPDAQLLTEVHKATPAIGKLDMKRAFSIANEDDPKPEKTAPVVNKLNISKAFPVNGHEETASNTEKNIKVGKLNMGPVFHNQVPNDNAENNESPQRFSPGKLDTSKLFQDDSNEERKSEQKSVGKLKIGSLFPQNESETSNEAKPKMEVGKLNVTGVFSQKESESETKGVDNVNKETMPQTNKLDLSQFLQSNAEFAAVEKDIPSSVRKLNVNAFVSPNDAEGGTESENEALKVGKLKINSEMFATENEEEQKAKAAKVSRTQRIRKIDKNRFLNSQSEGEDEAKIKSEKPLTVGKLNVNAMKFVGTDLDENEESAELEKSSPVVGKLNVSADMFMSANEEMLTQLEQSKRERTQTISKIDTSKLFANNEEASEAKEEQKAPERKKLNVSEKLFQEDADEKLEKMKSEKLSRISSINRIDRTKLFLKAKDEEEDNEPKPEKPQVNKLKISEEMFRQSSSEPLPNEEKAVSVGKIDKSKLFAQTEESEPVRKEVLEVKKLRVSEDVFREESDEKLEKLKNEKLSRVNSINKIDRSKLILKSKDDEESENLKPEKTQVNKLRISEEMFCQSSENVPNEANVVSVGRIDTSKLFEQNEELAPIKKEVLEVKKLTFSEDAFREDSDEKLRKLKKDKLSRVNSINKIDRSKLILKSKEEDEESASRKPERPQVKKLQISESMFTESSETPATTERLMNVGKIDKSMLQFSEDPGMKRTVEDGPPVNISKLNVSESMFMPSEAEDDSVKQSKLQRNQSIKRMDSSRYVLSNSDDVNPDSETRRPSITANVGKLNMDGLFSSADSGKTEQLPKKRNLQELMKEEKEKSKMPTVQKSSMHAQHVKSENQQFEEDEVISAQSANACFSAPSFPGSEDVGSNSGKETHASHSDTFNGKTGVLNGNSTAPSSQQNKSIISPELEKQSKCKVCQKRVYETEKITVSGTLYHKVCFRCAQCNNTLRLTNYCLSVAGEVYCKPHFEQLFRVTGSYNIESNSGALKSFHESAENEKREEDVIENEDVALPDLKSIKSRFESGSHGDGSGGQNTVVIDKEANANNGSGVKVSTLKSQWASMSSNGTADSENVVQKNRNNDIELCRSASQLRAEFDKKNTTENSEEKPPMEDPRLASLDPDRVKEDLNQKERPETIAGGLASVKNLFESGVSNNRPLSEQKNGPTVADESLQAALANRAISAKTLFQTSPAHYSGATESGEEEPPQKVEDESLLAARQGKSVAMRSVFENNRNSGTTSPRSGDVDSGEGAATRHQDELAAIRASRGVNMKAVFENGGVAESKTVTSKTYEDESLAAARANRGVANKAVFEGGAQSEDNFTKSAANVTADVQAGKAKDLLSKFESGQVNESNKKATEAVADKSNNKDEQQSKLIKKQATEEDSSSPQQFQKSVSDEPPQQQPHPNGTAVLVDVSPSSPTATNGTEEPVAQIPDVVVSLESEEQSG